MTRNKKNIEVLKNIILFLNPIYNAIVHEDEFLQKWSCKDKKWTSFS